MAKFIKTPVKGMCDQLPADMRLREHVLSMIKTSYSRFGFTQIETPVMEHIENLTSKQGGDNEKLIFKVMKRGDKLTSALGSGDPKQLSDMGLRYDLTLPLSSLPGSCPSSAHLQSQAAWPGKRKLPRQRAPCLPQMECLFSC